MANLDQISEAIGRLRSDVQNVAEKIDHVHECLHAPAGFVPRLEALERSKARSQGIAAGVGFLSGGGAGVAVKVLLAKITGG